MSRCIVTIVAILACASVAQAQPLTSEQVADAISLGERGKDCRVRIGISDYTIIVAGPYARIIQAMHTAREKLQPFGVEDVDARLAAPTLQIVVTPDRPRHRLGRWQVPSPVTAIAMMPKGSEDMSQAIRGEFEQAPVSWTNAMGGRFGSAAGVAVFDMSMLPPTEVDILVATGQRTQRRTLTAKHRASLMCR